jgi:hypothetical protein
LLTSICELSIYTGVLVKMSTQNLLTYTSQQKKRYKDFFKYIFMLKPKQLFIIIYVNVCVKRVYPHKTNNTMIEFAMKMKEGGGGQDPIILP